MTHRLCTSFVRGCGVAAVFFMASQLTAQVITDGFGDADRNNDGTVAPYDTDIDLSETIDGGEVAAASDAGDVGIVWAATRGFTSSNTGDPKANIKIIDDSAGIGSGYALAYEGKGSGSSIGGFFGESLNLLREGDLLQVKFDFRLWTDSPNPTGAPNNGQLRWGLFQDTDGQLGMTNDVGLIDGGVAATVEWGADDGDWRSADPGPVGDKGVWARVPIGPGSDAGDARINYENNTSRFLEGSSVGGGGDQDTVASPSNDGPGGQIASLATQTLMMEVVRTADSIEVATFLNGTEMLRDEINLADPDVVVLGDPPTSFDYMALRNTGSNGDWDFIIDNVMISVSRIPEPGTASLLLAIALAGLCVRRRT